MSNNIVSELVYDRTYQNAVQAIHNYHPPAHVGFENVKDLGVELTSFKKYQETSKVDLDRLRHKR